MAGCVSRALGRGLPLGAAPSASPPSLPARPPRCPAPSPLLPPWRASKGAGGGGRGRRGASAWAAGLPFLLHLGAGAVCPLGQQGSRASSHKSRSTPRCVTWLQRPPRKQYLLSLRTIARLGPSPEPPLGRIQGPVARLFPPRGNAALTVLRTQVPREGFANVCGGVRLRRGLSPRSGTTSLRGDATARGRAPGSRSGPRGE